MDEGLEHLIAHQKQRIAQKASNIARSQAFHKSIGQHLPAVKQTGQQAIHVTKQVGQVAHDHGTPIIKKLLKKLPGALFHTVTNGAFKHHPQGKSPMKYHEFKASLDNETKAKKQQKINDLAKGKLHSDTHATLQNAFEKARAERERKLKTSQLTMRSANNNKKIREAVELIKEALTPSELSEELIFIEQLDVNQMVDIFNQMPMSELRQVYDIADQLEEGLGSALKKTGHFLYKHRHKIIAGTALAAGVAAAAYGYHHPGHFVPPAPTGTEYAPGEAAKVAAARAGAVGYGAVRVGAAAASAAKQAYKNRKAKKSSMKESADLTEAKMPNQKAIDEKLLGIAKSELHFETLELRGRDSLDFRDVGVLSVKNALRLAYNVGYDDASKSK